MRGSYFCEKYHIVRHHQFKRLLTLYFCSNVAMPEEGQNETSSVSQLSNPQERDPLIPENDPSQENPSVDGLKEEVCLNVGPIETERRCSSASESSTTSSDSGVMCRICHCKDEPDNMVSPCRCAGSLKYVHQLCLLKWLHSNEHYNKYHCELCTYEYLLKPKPWVEWQMPQLSPTEQRRATCLVVICILAFLIVIWSINDLVTNIDTVKLHLTWGFWTKLLFITFGVVIIGFQYSTFKYFFIKLRESNQIVMLNESNRSLKCDQQQIYVTTDIS